MENNNAFRDCQVPGLNFQGKPAFRAGGEISLVFSFHGIGNITIVHAEMALSIPNEPNTSFKSASPKPRNSITSGAGVCM